MGKFAEVATKLMKTADDWQARLAGQEQRLHDVVPSGHDEAVTRAQEILTRLRLMARNTGYQMREQRPRKTIDQFLPAGEPTGAMGREKLVTIPATEKTADWLEPRLFSKQALISFLTDPIKNKFEESALDLHKLMDDKRERALRVTGDPATLPTFLPAAAMTVPQSFMEGYRDADKTQKTRLDDEMNQRLEKAKLEFETALKDEYAASSHKAASAGEFIDGLAQWWNQDLTKSADGELNKVLGMYLAAAGLLGVGSHAAVKSLWEQRDPRYQKYKAMQDLVKQRQRQSTLPVYVTEEHLPAETMAKALAQPQDELGIEHTEDTAVPGSSTKVGSLRNALVIAGGEAANDISDRVSERLRKRAKHTRKG